MWDSTSHRIVSITFFTARIMKNGAIKSIVLQYCYVSIGFTSEETVEVTQEILSEGKDYLRVWIERCEKECSSFVHDMPSPESITLKNFHN